MQLKDYTHAFKFLKHCLPGPVDIVRLSSVYDATSFLAPHINANLKGLGHNGWSEGNPTHCLRFARAAENVNFTYKSHEFIDTWGPKHVFEWSYYKMSLLRICLKKPIDYRKPAHSGSNCLMLHQIARLACVLLTMRAQSTRSKL